MQDIFGIYFVAHFNWINFKAIIIDWNDMNLEWVQTCNVSSIIIHYIY